MSSQHGAFIWYELMTSDSEAAAAFYGSVVGWTSRPFDPADPDRYGLFSTGETEAGGFMRLPEGNDCPAGAEPGWIAYIGVENVDSSLQDLLADGATQLLSPTDIPDIGRFAVVADPQGAAFCIMRGAGDEESRAFSHDKAGHSQWNELLTSDPEAAFSFYARHFGWEKGEVMPTDAGDYQLLDLGGRSFGAVMRAPPGAPTGWGFYFGVADIDVAVERTKSGGGEVLHGPHEIPGGHFIIHARDPQGARFALVGPRRAA